MYLASKIISIMYYLIDDVVRIIHTMRTYMQSKPRYVHVHAVTTFIYRLTHTKNSWDMIHNYSPYVRWIYDDYDDRLSGLPLNRDIDWTYTT